MALMPLISHCDLKRLLHYDPQTGAWTWLARSGPGSHVRPGDVAGTVNKAGYLRIRVMSVFYMGHRLAWFYMTGEWPAAEVDHRDCDPSNIRWDNLREATSSQNGANKRVYANNALGIKGVTARRGRYRAVIKKDGRVIHIGMFDTIEQAAAAYADRAKAMHGEFWRA
jgi:hypothetical protein